MENQYSDNQRTSHDVSPAQKLMLFLIGGGVGVAAGLLFAPKSGAALRSDIAGLVDKGYDKALVAVSEIKDRTSEYYEVAKGTGGDVLEVVSSGLSMIKDEVRTDVVKIGSILQSSPVCGATQDTSRRYRLTESAGSIQEGIKP
jgi:gas vesicle protein